MTAGKEKNHKLYYSIKEVAAELGVSESTLRYWESEFPQIAPKKGGNNVRAGLFGMGVYASHGVERTHKDGIENTARLMLAYVLGE